MSLHPRMADENASGGERELLIMAGAGWVQALDSGSGEAAWTVELGSPKPTTPSVGVSGDRVIIATSGQIYCVDYASGKRLWQRPCLGAHSRPTLLVEEGRIYIAGTSRTECFDTDSKQLWAGNAPAVTGYISLATKTGAAQADVGS